MENLADLDSRGGVLFVISGPSGVGKDTVIAKLKEEHVPLHYTVTMTTRKRRPGEVDGVSYYFVERPEFEELQARGELLEAAVVHGELYGTPLRQVREALAKGRDVLLKIDVQGAATIKDKLPDAVFIFLAPGSQEDLVHRMAHRASESEAEFRLRLHNATGELSHLYLYDYVVVNRHGKLDEAVEKVKAIITAEGCRVDRRPNRI
ncbi:MAG: guanylate kinase [Chloroflexi bacterium]|nr:guanylate kinase [Chloroflexota bacterium]